MYSPYFFFRFYNSKRSGVDEDLRLDGDGDQTRDYIHVYDVAQACITALEYSESVITNIASGKSVSNNEILSVLREYHNVEIINAPQRHGDIRHSLGDTKNAKLKLDFTPTIQLRDGILGLLGQTANE